MSFAQFVQDVITTFSQDYGVSSFFSSPQAAAEWVETNVIEPNPNLTYEEKGILRFWSLESLEFAIQEVGTKASISSTDGAYIYWDLMRDYITYHCQYEPACADLYNLFNIAADSAQDVSTPTEQIKVSVKLPWWIIALPFAFLFFKRR